MNNYSIFDIEADGLIEDATKIHCLVYSNFKDGVQTNIATTDYNEMRLFFSTSEILIGHKIVTYDIPMVEKFLGIKVKAKLIDTLGLSWYLYPLRKVHGLEDWGTEFGIEKPKVVDWKNEKPEVYIHRCIEDVKINTKLWEHEYHYLQKLYESEAAIDRFTGYLSFKLDCAREQEEIKIKIDRQKCIENLEILNKIRNEKIAILSEIMPPHITYKIKARPKVMFKKDGTVSKLGQDWYNLLKEQGLPEYHMGALKLVDKVEKGNPNSIDQVKDWLYSLGWKPTTFAYVKDKDTPYDKETPPREVPQLKKDDNSGDLCDSVLELIEENPEVAELEDLSIVTNRISYLTGKNGNSFLESIDENDMLKAEIAGFTNTLRFKHRKPIANLPGVPKKYWEMVRSCLIAPDENHVLCGSDMSGLEDNCKQHYMYFYDPDYVRELRTPGFDSHIDIAIRAKLISWDEGEFYKWYDAKKEGKKYDYVGASLYQKAQENGVTNLNFIELINLTEDQQKEIIKTLKPIRLKAKKTNFAAVYGAGGPKIALTANVPTKEGYTFHRIYWERNKAVKQVAENTIHKTILGQMWLYNPVSQFWYTLRYTKDKFSTLNQGTGVYAFDTWTRYCREQGYKICMQYHDEHVGAILKGEEEKVRQILTTALDKTNEVLKLNVKLGISIAFGDNYATIH